METHYFHDSPTVNQSTSGQPLDWEWFLFILLFVGSLWGGIILGVQWLLG